MPAKTGNSTRKPTRSSVRKHEKSGEELQAAQNKKLREALKIPEYKMYPDHGNHACIFVTPSEGEAVAWKKQLEGAFSVHIEKYNRVTSKGSHMYAVYVHG